MLIKEQKPFDAFKVYKVYHKKQKRFYAQLKHKYTSSRTTITYAKYVMSVSLGRILEKEEEVDHIDNNKLNDDISNLQILTKKQNLEKSKKEEAVVDCICEMCGTSFTRPKRLAHHTRNPNVRCFCSKTCFHLSR